MGFKDHLLTEEKSALMSTTSAEKGKIRVIIQRLLDGDNEWFRRKDVNINIGNKSGFWILNYGLGERTQWNYLCRGLIVRQPGRTELVHEPLTLIVSFPFTRFYNQGEENAANINFANSDMLEKLDGTMVGVTIHDGRILFHTRKMHSAHERDMGMSIKSLQDPSKTMFLMREIEKYVRKLDPSSMGNDMTYVFEFIHEASFVWTKYKPEQYGLYLIGARNISTHEEMSEDELDQTAKYLGVRRPRRWNATADHAKILEMIKVASEETPDFEGFVFRDRETGHRLKIKDPHYVEMHHNLDKLRFKNLIVKFLEDEQDEVVAYFPGAKEMLRTIERQYNRYLDKVVAKVKEWNLSGLTGQALTNALFGHNPLPKWQIRLMKMRGEEVPKPKHAETDSFIVNHILQLVDKDDDEIRRKVDFDLRKIALGDKGMGIGTNEGNPKELLAMIGIDDSEDENDAVYDDG